MKTAMMLIFISALFEFFMIFNFFIADAFNTKASDIYDNHFEIDNLPIYLFRIINGQR